MSFFFFFLDRVIIRRAGGFGVLFLMFISLRELSRDCCLVVRLECLYGSQDRSDIYAPCLISVLK